MTGAARGDDEVPEEATADLLGVVLAGGQSRRFGSPKALATFEGEPLWRRAVRALETVGLPVLVLANDPQVVAAVTGGVAAGVAAPVRSDLRPDRGPLAGVETGLIEARERGFGGILVLACDLVRVEGALLSGLAAAWSGSGVAVFEAPGPWGAEPLCAVWGLDTLDAVTAALDAGRGSPGALLSEVLHHRVPLRSVSPSAEPESIFQSANRPGDLPGLEPASE